MADAPSPSGSSAGESSSQEAPASFVRRWSRRVLWGIGSLVGTVVLLLGLLLLVLQTETGATAAAQFLARQANPFPNTELTVGSASGSWIGSLQLTDVSLTRLDSTSGAALTMAHVDTLSAQYRLGTLLRGRIHVTDAFLAGPSATMRQSADSTWDWIRLLSTHEEPAPDTAAGPPIRIDRVHVRRGQFAAAYFAQGRDSTTRIDDLLLRAHDLRFGRETSIQLDTLGLRGHLPTNPSELRLAVRGGLASRQLQLDTLQFTSARSRLRGHGSARLPATPADTLDDVRFSLRADPLALQDLTLFVPTLDVDSGETVQFDSQITGSGQMLTAEADARFSGGGTLNVRGQATPYTTRAPEAPPLRYQLDAEIQGLTTSLLGPFSAEENRVTGTVAARLEGPSLSRLTGTVDLDLRDTRLYGYQTPQLAVAADVRDGEAQFDLDGTVNEATVTASGTARPFDAAPSVALSARHSNANVEAFAPSTELETSLNGTTQFEARALGTDTTTSDVTVSLERSQVGNQSIEEGQIELAVQPDQLWLDADLQLPTGSVQAAGYAFLDGSQRFLLETGRFENVNVAALVGDTTENRMTGTLQARGQGYTPETMQLQATLSIEDSHYGPYRLSSLETTASLDDGQLTTQTSAALNGGSWTLAAGGRPFDTIPTLEITRGQFRDVDIGPFLQDTTQSSRLQGSLEGTARAPTDSTLQLDARLALDSSRVNRQTISNAALAVRLQDGQLDANLDMDLPSGTVRLTAAGRPFDEIPTYRLTEGTFENLNLGSLGGVAGLNTALSGQLTLTGGGTSVSTLSLDSELTLNGSTINQAALSSGRLDIQMENGQGAASGRFDVAGGRIELDGQLDAQSDTLGYTFRSSVDSLDLAALAGRDSLIARVEAARWRFEGRGSRLAELSGATSLSATSVRLRRLQLDTLSLAGTLQDGLLTLDTLDIQSNVGTGWGRGTLALLRGAGASDFDVEVAISDGAPLGEFIGAELLRLGSGHFEAHVYGPVGEQRFDGRLQLESLVYNTFRLSSAAFDVNGRQGTEQLLDRVEVNGGTGHLSLPSLAVEETNVKALYDGSMVDLSSFVTLDPRHTVDLGATFRPTVDPLEVTLNRLQLRLDADRWSLSQPTTITVGDYYRVDSLLLTGNSSQRISASGVVDPGGTQSLAASIENFRLGSIAPLFGLSGLDGTLNGTVNLTGDASSPHLDGQLALDLRSEGNDVGTLRLDVGYDSLTVALDARLTHTDGGVLTASGSVPVDLRLQASTPSNVALQPIRLDVSTEQFPIDWIGPFLDPATVRDVRGTLAGTAAVRGTRDEPDLSGTASVSGAGVALPTLQTEYEDGSASLTLSEDRLVLEDALLYSTNGGRLRASGTVQFPQLTVGEYNLELRASDFLVIDTRAYRSAVIDGTTTLSGTTQQPVLTGNVEILSGDIYYSEVLAESGTAETTVTLTQEDQITLEERFGFRLTEADLSTFDLYAALELDLSVEIQRDVWLRSTSTPEMNVQFTGTLDVQKAPNVDPQVFGTISVLGERSTLQQFGQEFQITEGTLTFNGDPYTPYLNLTAVYDQRARGSSESEVTITLSLTGRPDDLQPTLSSDPAMDTRNIFSYLATGRPANELIGGSSEGGSIATQVALGQASNFVENLAASELGLDVVRLEIQPGGVSFLTMGRYLTPRFFASIEQPVITSSLQTTRQSNTLIPDLTLEYQLTDYLLLRSRNSQQSFQLTLFFEYAY